MDVPTAPPAANGEALYLAHRAVIDRVIAFVCGRHRLSAEDAEDFAAEVRLRIVEQDYAILRKYEGRSSIGTYLSVVVQRLFLDHRIRSWGKWRPSAAARRAGPVGIALDKLLTRDGFAFDDACRAIETKFGAVDRARLERLATALPPRVRRMLEPEDALAEVPSPAAAPDALAAERETQGVADRLVQAIRTHAGDLDANDQLLLRLRFEDGRTIPDIAALLRVEAKPLYRRIERLLAELKRRLEAEGLTARDAQDVLAHPEAVEWDSALGRIPAGRPSQSEGGREWR